MTTNIRNQICVATTTFKGPHNLSEMERESYRDGVKELITSLDSEATFHPEQNPSLFWVSTTLTTSEIDGLDGVFSAILAAI